MAPLKSIPCLGRGQSPESQKGMVSACRAFRKQDPHPCPDTSLAFTCSALTPRVKAGAPSPTLKGTHLRAMVVLRAAPRRLKDIPYPRRHPPRLQWPHCPLEEVSPGSEGIWGRPGDWMRSRRQSQAAASEPRQEVPTKIHPGKM